MTPDTAPDTTPPADAVAPDVADLALEASATPARPHYEDHDRLNRTELAEYLGWARGTVQRLVATEAWRWDELPWPAYYRRNSSRTHWLFADVRDWRPASGRSAASGGR